MKPKPPTTFLKKAADPLQVLYISMEYCEGRNLKHFISDSAKPGQKQAVIVEKKMRIFSQIVDALHYLHETGLMHRDLKP